MIIEYKLHKVRARSDNKKTPIWVEEGGHFYDPTNHTYVGCISDNVEHYIPDSLTVFTKETFETKILAMHASTPFTQRNDENEETVMTNAEVSTMANTWFDTKSAEFS